MNSFASLISAPVSRFFSGIWEIRGGVFFRHPAITLFFLFWTILFLLNFHTTIALPSPLRVNGGCFAQYYAGGIVATSRTWQDLFPKDIPIAKGPMSGTLSDSLERKLAVRGANDHTKWIFPPQLAFCFVPYAAFNYETALKLHTACLILLCGLLLAITERFFLKCGFSWRATQLGLVAMAFSMGMRQSIISSNLSPVTGVGTALALSGMTHGRIAETLAGFVLPGLTKGSSAFWMPLLVVRKDWRTILWGCIAVCGLATIGCIAGINHEIYSEFISVLSSGRGTLYKIHANLSVAAMLVACSGGALNAGIALTTTSIASITLLLAVILLSLRRMAINDNRTIPLYIMATLLIFDFFSNICWTHYSTHFMALVPICLSICEPKRRRLLVFAMFPFLFDPGIVRAVSLVCNCPTLEYMPTVGGIALLTWALCGLAKDSQRSAP